MKKPLAILSVVLFANQASADPSSDIETLMKRPVSLFDFGMYKLNLEVTSIETRIKRYFDRYPYEKFGPIDPDYEEDDNSSVIAAYYDDENIRITELVFTPSFSIDTIKDAKYICELRYKYFDDEFNVGDEKKCSLCNFFADEMFSPELDDVLVELKDRFYYHTFLGQYVCSRKVYGTLITVTDSLAESE